MPNTVYFRSFIHRLIDNKNLNDHFNFISSEEYKDTFEIKK